MEGNTSYGDDDDDGDDGVGLLNSEWKTRYVH